MVKDLLEAMWKAGDVPEVAVMMDGCEYEDIDWPLHWKIHSSEEHLEMGGSLNLLMKLHPDEERYGLLTDHSRPLSEGWAETLEKYSGDWGIASSVNGKTRINPRTGMQRLDCFAMGGKLARELGYIWHPSMVHMYADDVLEDIGYGIGRLKFVREVLFDELQLRDGTLKPDGNSKRVFKGKHFIPDDQKAYDRWLENEKHPTIERIKRKMYDT